MTAKKLQKDSKYLKHDLDGDGIVTDEEIAREERIIRLENNDKMQDQQRMLCWVSMLSMIVIIAVILSPIVPNERVQMCTALLSTYIVANLGIIATFMGTTAFTRTRENGN